MHYYADFRSRSVKVIAPPSALVTELTTDHLGQMRLFVVALFACLCVSAEARTWTHIDGRKMEADYVSVGRETVTIRLDRDNRIYQVALARLSEADRKFVADQVRASTDKERKSGASSKVAEHLKDVRRTLVDAAGKRWSGAAPEDSRYTLFYFSAHWCPPCQIFTPKLVSFYKEHKKSNNFEIIFISSDYSEGEMETYMQAFAMPWPALKYSRIDDIDLSAYKGPGIPCLVLFDRQGRVLSHSYVEGNYAGPSKVLRDLRKRL